MLLPGLRIAAVTANIPSDGCRTVAEAGVLYSKALIPTMPAFRTTPLSFPAMKDLDTLLFKVRLTLDKPRCGSLLMEAPFVNDVKFRHSVVSIIDYVATEGATGVVLNNPTGYTLAELLDDESVGGDVPVYRGGPIGQDRLFFLHNLGTAIIPGAREYSPGMFVGGDFDAVISYLRSGYASDGYIKFFIGYCSWADGQLENEIGQAHWAILDTLPPSGVLLCGTGDSMWHAMVRRLGEDYRSWQLVPANPKAN